jgi:hypothetical protein
MGREDDQANPIGRLTVHLQGGFANDTVVVSVDGKEIYRKAAVRTKLLLGYADIIETRVPEGTAEISIGVPSRHIADRFKIQISPKTHVGVSIQGDSIDHFVSRKAFGYM